MQKHFSSHIIWLSLSAMCSARLSVVRICVHFFPNPFLGWRVIEQTWFMANRQTDKQIHMHSGQKQHLFASMREIIPLRVWNYSWSRPNGTRLEYLWCFWDTINRNLFAKNFSRRINNTKLSLAYEYIIILYI